MSTIITGIDMPKSCTKCSCLDNEIKSQIESIAYDEATLSDWYITNAGDEGPVWTDEHIIEVINDFYLIPKSELSMLERLIMSCYNLGRDNGKEEAFNIIKNTINIEDYGNEQLIIAKYNIIKKAMEI